MPVQKRLLFLYSSLNGFVLSTLRALQDTGECESIDVVHWPYGSTPGNLYKPEQLRAVRFHPRETLTTFRLRELLATVQPHIIYISGWMDRGYLDAVRAHRAAMDTRAVTVCGIDDQWRATWRQRIGRLVFRLSLRKVFDRMWVAGAPQYHYARKFGYADHEIIPHLLSADDQRFLPAEMVARRFVFVGRFESVKGPTLLLEAYAGLDAETRSAWPLVMIGDGSLRAELQDALPSGASILPYLQPAELALELSRGGVGCQPSLFEQWGVSIHELTLMAYPMIVSSACGAATEFVVHGHNGYVFRGGDAKALRNAMLEMTKADALTLARFRQSSLDLSLRISPLSSARNFLSADASWRRTAC